MKIMLPYLAFLLVLCDFSKCAFTPSKPTVEFGTEKYFAGRLWVERVYLTCSVTPFLNTSLLYQVNWYDDGQMVYTSPLVTASEFSSTHFRSENGLRLASLISCAVISKSDDSDTGHISLRSEEFFAGIKTVQSPVKLERGQSARIGIYPSVPFGCLFYFQYDKEPMNCELEIVISIPRESNCDPHIMVQDGCVLRMRRREWNVTHYFTLKHIDTSQYAIPMIYSVSLKSEGYSYGTEWKHFQQNITINLVDDKQWIGTSCTTTGHDVHLTTFSRRQFTIIQDGTYTLFRNSLDVEVDVKLQSCRGGMCVCGVAVIAGGDVFIIDLCETHRYFGFTQCKNNFIKVRKLDEFNYKIYLPFETYLRIRLMFVYASHVMYVEIFPSSHDISRSVGLCGQLGTHQLITNNGVVSAINDFIHSWRTVDLNTIKSSDYGTMTASTEPSFCSCRDDTTSHSTNCTQFPSLPFECKMGLFKPIRSQCSSTPVFG